jgi:hypothetical protein
MPRHEGARGVYLRHARAWREVHVQHGHREHGEPDSDDKPMEGLDAVIRWELPGGYWHEAQGQGLQARPPPAHGERTEWKTMPIVPEGLVSPAHTRRSKGRGETSASRLHETEPRHTTEEAAMAVLGPQKV